MAEYFLTLAEIAGKLKVPESTIRSWRNKYVDFIPYVGSGRKRRYPESALKVFKRICELSAEGVTAINIAERLSTDFSRHTDNSSTNSSKAAHDLMAPTTAIERMAQAFERLADQQQETQELRKRVEYLENRLQEMDQGRNQRKSFWKRNHSKEI
jgi:DNA-binding transcriptional MerR regulator